MRYCVTINSVKDWSLTHISILPSVKDVIMILCYVTA
uniref:Uncharacterized protein n=1 Tax=Arundo donax TaxID=35708 RepID=A0A0A8ZQK1_ARUDO